MYPYLPLGLAALVGQEMSRTEHSWGHELLQAGHKAYLARTIPNRRIHAGPEGGDAEGILFAKVCSPTRLACEVLTVMKRCR